jgi:hypothetical protein
MEPNNANVRLATTPFGMAAFRWPGVYDRFNGMTRWTPQEDGLLYATFDMVKMEVLQLLIERYNDQTLTRSSTFEISSAMTSGISAI